MTETADDLDMRALFSRAKAEYARLVALPYSGWERAYSTVSLAFMRDFIAVCENRSGEDVQLEYVEKYPPPMSWGATSPNVFPPTFGGRSIESKDPAPPGSST